MKFVCLQTGSKYPEVYVERLYKGLARNTSKPFEFQVIRETRYPGWWGKIECFNPKERIILLDIDLVITGNVDFLGDYGGQFCAWRDPNYPDRLNGSIHSIGAGYGALLQEAFYANAERMMRVYHSDQDFLRDHTTPDYWPDGLIKSFKADHCEEGPKGASIVVFHGYPKMHDLNDIPWIETHWR